MYKKTFQTQSKLDLTFKKIIILKLLNDIINYIIFTKKEHDSSSKRLLLKTLIIMLLFFPICCTISLFHEEISRWLQGQKIQTGFFLLDDDYIFDVLKINDVRLFEKVIFSSTNNIQFDSKYLKYF